MAKIGYAGLCLFILLATLAHCGHASATSQAQIGSIHMFNAADHDLLYSTTVRTSDGRHTSDLTYSTLSKGTSFNFEVMDDMICVTTAFRMPTPGGEYDQLIRDWCSPPRWMQIQCLPNCFWLIDDTGFSVANSLHGQLQFLTKWHGPYEA